jgi:hypothetical protein
MWPVRSSASCLELELDGHRIITACDVTSSYTWAELHVTPKNPSAQWTSALARRVAQELSERGWKLEAATTDCDDSPALPGAA